MLRKKVQPNKSIRRKFLCAEKMPIFLGYKTRREAESVLTAQVRSFTSYRRLGHSYSESISLGNVMNLRRPIFTLLVLSISFALAQTGASAQDSSPLYKLKATQASQSRLSRTEVDVSNLGALAPQAPPKMALAATAQASPVALPAANNEPIDKSYLQEYAVDWSGWIARLADRWYYVLRMNEEVVGNAFVTARPALIQFTCYSNGQIGNVFLKQSSGDPAYDRLQMIALMQAAPLHAFPQGTHRTSITLVQGWESHIKQAGEQDFVPGSFGKGFPMEKVKQWVKAN